jgi:serine/threonine-protein kinase
MPVDAPGRIIAGRYELVSRAGEGGMAVVWKARTHGAGPFAKPVAIKRIQDAKRANPQFVRMFEEEARLGSRLQHPNIVQILDFGLDEEGSYYLVMEWIEGLDMLQWVRAFSGGLRETPWPLVAAIGIEVCRALAAAHESVDATGAPAPVYHRDVSPSNVLLSTDGVVKLSDFGLARAMDRASMTRPNAIKGKLAYCAPELIAGAKPSPQSDLFALGVVLWEALAQRRLFTGKNDLELLLAVRRGEVPLLTTLRRDIPQSLALAVHQALAGDPNARYENCRVMAHALAAVLGSEGEHADAERLGASVRAARAELGKDDEPQAPPVSAPLAGVPPQGLGSESTVEELSVSEIGPRGGVEAPVPLVQKKTK